MPTSGPSTDLTLAQSRIAALEAELSAARAERDRVLAERDTLREAYAAVKLELELLKKRLFVAKAERVDVQQLELEFAAKLAELDALAKRLEPLPDSVVPSVPGGASPKAPKKPTGRRDFSELDLPEETVELLDAALEGKAPRSGFEVSYQLEWRRGSMVRLKVMRAKYRVQLDGAEDEKTEARRTRLATHRRHPCFVLLPSSVGLRDVAVRRRVGSSSTRVLYRSNRAVRFRSSPFVAPGSSRSSRKRPTPS